MQLVHRVTELDPKGGRYGLGLIRAEADIHPDDWFLTCHFVDDRVMPGTLMYECCMHTLRIFLLRMGWVAEADGRGLAAGARRGEPALLPRPGAGDHESGDLRGDGPGTGLPARSRTPSSTP